ncbi:hypothetical protein SUGI_0643490 [Cryptomeria japonica]|nr:hypothetical protein SUGI_0643490 [Cryptomeria japonica]
MRKEEKFSKAAKVELEMVKSTKAQEVKDEAITLYPDRIIYWTNRALCYKKLKDWKRVEADSRKALELDNQCVKALYLLGLAMLESKQYVEAISLLNKAMELSKVEKLIDYFVYSRDALAKAQYEEWEHASTLRIQRQQELREICERAIKLDHDEAVKNLESASGKSNDSVIVIDDETHHEDIHKFSVRRAQAQEHQQRIRRSKRAEYLSTMYLERCHTLSEVFDKAAQCDIPSEIPDHLTCRITLGILSDPVITPSGITYEKSSLLEHLQKVGEFDPVTRAPLLAEQIIPNFAIKAAVRAYLKENAWAYEHE